MLVALLVIAAVVSLSGGVLYNGLIQARNEIDRAFANVDVLLRQRADEIPNLVEVCRGYARHEQALLTEIIRAKERLCAARGVMAKGEAHLLLNEALGELYAQAAPNLRSDKVFLRLSQRLTALEEELADRREHFNAAVSRYNARLHQVPEVWLVRLFGLRPRPLFAEDSSRRLPHLGKNLF